MKYVCLGYIEDKYFADLTPKQQQEFMDACFAYDEELQKGGHTLLDREVQAFVRSKPPDHLNTEDVKGFLTDLAVRQNVAGATQNQAFDALLFFYRHVLRREFGKIDGVVRAKRRPYVPVVLSRGEVEAVLERLPAPYRLVGALLYGDCACRSTSSFASIASGCWLCMTARGRRIEQCPCRQG